MVKGVSRHNGGLHEVGHVTYVLRTSDDTRHSLSFIIEAPIIEEGLMGHNEEGRSKNGISRL